MSETFTMAMKARPDEIYGAGAFDRTIGTTTRVKLARGRETEGIIRRVVVSEDGSEAEITVEVPDGTLPAPPLSGYSIAGT
jgi:hypothetical protein